jgi:hypothetical protein
MHGTRIEINCATIFWSNLRVLRLPHGGGTISKEPTVKLTNFQYITVGPSNIKHFLFLCSIFLRLLSTHIARSYECSDKTTSSICIWIVIDFLSVNVVHKCDVKV